jgi:hypothetical protein
MSVRNANSQSVDGTTGKIADVPIAPASVAGTDVGTALAYNNGAVSVAFTPDSTYWPATSFTAISSPGSFTATGASSPLTVTGLNSQTAYTFTVTGTNSAATSVASSASASVTATTIPQTPTIGTVTRVSDSSVSLPFTGNTGGKNLSAVTITSSPSLSLSYSGTTSPVAVSGTYVYGTDYSFTMTSTNANGTSSASSASNTISPNTTQPTVYESIATLTLGSNQTSVTMSSIPSTYKHLQIRTISRGNRTAGDNIYIRFNSDSSANYSSHNVYASGSSTGAQADAPNAVQLTCSVCPPTSANSATFGAGITDIIDYSNTNKYKTTKSIQGTDTNGAGNMWFLSGNWRNTAAITSITFFATVEVATDTVFALYGIKG